MCRARTEARSPRSGRWPGADVGLGRREEAHGVIPRHREHGGGRWPCGLLSRWQNPASGTARDRDHGRLHLRPDRLWDPSSPAPWPAVSQGERNEPRDLSLSRQECPVRTQGSSAGWHLPQGAHSAQRTTSACRGEVSAVCPSWQTGCQPCPPVLVGRRRHRPREHVPITKVSSAKPRRPLPARAAVSLRSEERGVGGREVGGWTTSRQLHLGGGSV